MNERRPPLEETPAELRELVAQHNPMDIELYRFAREQFDAAAPGPDELADETEELRRLSVAVTAAGELHKAAMRAGKTTAHEAKRAAKAAREAKKAAKTAAHEARRAAKTAAHEEREARRADIRDERAAAKGPPRGRRPRPGEHWATR